MHLLGGAGFGGSDAAPVLLIRKTDSAEPTGPSKLSLRSSPSQIALRPIKVNWVTGVFPILRMWVRNVFSSGLENLICDRLDVLESKEGSVSIKSR